MYRPTFAVAALAASLLALPLAGQKLSHPREQVTVLPVAPVTVHGKSAGTLVIEFRVLPGYHINSNKPTSELLIPTTVKFNAPQQLQLGNAVYPAGREFALPIAPEEKLNVYADEVEVTVPISARAGSAPGSYSLKGELTYQACNDNSCFPPRTVPLEATVRVVR